MNENGIVSIPRGVRLHRDAVRERWVLLAPERVIALDDIGYTIMQEIEANQSSLSSIAQRLAERYNADLHEVRIDVSDFVRSLWQSRVLELH